MPNDHELYNLENYLFQTIHQNFKETGHLSAFDFFCIVIWKANRAKSRIATKLVFKSDPPFETLEQAVKALTNEINQTVSRRDRLRVLISAWKFRLPMASAVLAVLYPNEFTVYDVRVCGQLNGFHDLQQRTNFDSIWDGYEEYQQAVVRSVSNQDSLRDKDRELWARSFRVQLENDIRTMFSMEVSDELE